MRFSSASYQPPSEETWQQHWASIETMKSSSYPAPIDEYGVIPLSYSNNAYKNPRVLRFQTLIATMLSPRTKDAQTAEAFHNLNLLVSPLPLIASSVVQKSEQEIAIAIKPALFAATKAKHILAAAHKCVELFDDDIPSNIQDLFAFKGIGPKVGFLTFTVAWNRTEGICVDTHVHRISNRLGWVDTKNSKSNGPEKTRKELESFLPRDKWGHINSLFVGFGQTVCFAAVPKCNICSLSGDCKFYAESEYLKKVKSRNI